jgi:hypothetical protein
VTVQYARLAIGQVVEDRYKVLGEVFITDDGIARGPADVLRTLLHEAAHGVAQRRGVKDTSRRVEYHNARFRTVAEELGLRPDSRDPRFGWSRTTLAASAQRSTPRRSPSSPERSHTTQRPRPSLRRSPCTVLACRCGARARDARDTLKARGVICGVCASGHGSQAARVALHARLGAPAG